VTHARRIYGAPVPRRFPIVIADCAPYDQDLWQSIKGAFAGDLLTADGGTLILHTAAPEGNSSYGLVPYYAGFDPDLLRTRLLSGRVVDAPVRDAPLGGDAAMQAATGVLWGSLRKRVTLALVSAGLTAEDAAAMRAEYFTEVEAAMAAALSRLPPPARAGAVALIPQAGVVLPMPG
jgi:hypothetical protein